MGLRLSRSNTRSASDDTFGLFASTMAHYDSTMSLPTAATGHIGNRTYLNNCRPSQNNNRHLSRLKTSLWDCWRIGFNRLHEDVDDGDDDDYEKQIVSGTHRPSSAVADITGPSDARSRLMSDSSLAYLNGGLPQDIQDIHSQLRELKNLLSRPDLEQFSNSSSRDDSVSISDIDGLCQLRLQQNECMITSLQTEINRLTKQLEEQSKQSEEFQKELCVLRTQQIRRNVDSDLKNVDSLLTFLEKVKSQRNLRVTEIDKMDEVIGLLSCLSTIQKSQIQYDKSNVAVVNPCTNFTSDFSTQIHESTHRLSEAAQHKDSLKSEQSFFAETKLIYFIGRSPTPLIKSLFIEPSKITLAVVKDNISLTTLPSTKHRYIFKSHPTDQGNRQCELTQDTDYVPVIEGKIFMWVYVIE